jgi:hypothetical protein
MRFEQRSFEDGGHRFTELVDQVSGFRIRSRTNKYRPQKSGRSLARLSLSRRRLFGSAGRLEKSRHSDGILYPPPTRRALTV